MITSLNYLGLDEAEAFIPNGRTLAISILSPHRTPARLHEAISPVLRLYFEDTTVNAGEHKPGAFNTGHAQAILDFLRAEQANPAPVHLLVHCEAGISRSAAVAVFAASECRVPITGQIAFLNPWVLATLVQVAYPHYAF